MCLSKTSWLKLIAFACVISVPLLLTANFSMVEKAKFRRRFPPPAMTWDVVDRFKKGDATEDGTNTGELLASNDNSVLGKESNDVSSYDRRRLVVPEVERLSQSEKGNEKYGHRLDRDQEATNEDYWNDTIHMAVVQKDRKEDRKAKKESQNRKRDEEESEDTDEET